VVGAATRASDLPPARRAVIYAALLLASLAYNYNFVLIDYIRPFLISGLHMSLQQTALLYSAQACGVIFGAFATPVLVVRAGGRNALLIAATALAGLTSLNLVFGSFAAWATIRFLAGIGLSGCYVAATTLLANLFPQGMRARLTAVYMAMFNIAQITAGALLAAFGAGGWRWLVLLGALAPAAIAAGGWILLPDDRRLVAQGARTAAETRSGSWVEMLRGRRLWLTLACLLLAGLNFSAYQFYSGFITTYLLTVRHFGSGLTGLFVVIDGVGGLAGSLLFGWLADRLGRKAGAAGFVIAAVLATGVLIAPANRLLLGALELGYAISLPCTVIWAAYFAELFPVRLRPMGASLFHGGHILSVGAPLLVAVIAAHAPLAVGMALAPGAFLLGALIWSLLPETLPSARRLNTFDPETATAV
jgi:MFS family permease